MIIIDTQEKIDALLPKSGKYSVSDLYSPINELGSVLFKGLSFNEKVYFDFLKTLKPFSSAIFKDCLFSSRDFGFDSIVNFPSTSRMVIDSCKFQGVKINVDNGLLPPVIILNSVSSDRSVDITPFNSGIFIVNSNISEIYVGYNNQQDFTISGSKFEEFHIINSSYSTINNDRMVIRGTLIEKMFLGRHATGIFHISRDGSTYKSLFNNRDIKNLYLDGIVRGCDLTGVDFSNVVFSDESRGFLECNLSGADFSQVRVLPGEDSNIYFLLFRNCIGLDTMKLPEHTEISQHNDNEYVLVFRDL